MKHALEAYDLEIKAVGPIFVGSGYEIQKKEYAFLNKNIVGVIDVEKLYQLVKKRHLTTDFENFMLKDVREDLKHWSIRNKIPMSELEKCMKYTMNAGDIQMEKGRMQIMACAVDPYGNPYIPGSSIKGMLRTVLLCADILRNAEKYESEERPILAALNDERAKRNTVLARNIKSVEDKAFHTLKRSDRHSDAVNDELSGIIISDSEPLSRNDIILCQKWEQHTDGSYKTLNLLRECVKPGTVIKSTITIDHTISKLRKEEVEEAIHLFYKMYYQMFQRKFPRNEKGNDNTVFLGGGSGFVSKTMIYALFGQEGTRVTTMIFDKTRVPREHKHYQDTRLGVSPHILKCTKYNGKEYMMGQCELTLH